MLRPSQPHSHESKQSAAESHRGAHRKVFRTRCARGSFPVGGR